MTRPPYAIWSIWKQLSDLQHLFLFALCALCIYSAFSAVVIIVRLRSAKNLKPDKGIASAKECVRALRNRSANLHCVITAAFYLFGVVLFMAFQTVGLYIMGDAVESQLLGSFIVNCAFATNVFAIFLVLHLVQWFVVRKLNAYSESLPQ